ncbi:hydrogenase accessory protein HypB [Rhodomicrobium vannielii ATCC 17100]|uniref:Hydrogenase maturation factor HypB n=1 Tax=Rhodomicrobium vannielii (strain ATCC 17100 / DSM 162 / LMG 4299 / NCIMB 10020 / ATH 3.1.1) TaxID=648757 RepID=E3I2G6_RHOVT|nr:hydrogenase nickel incorporation protein HypB [Rhodomicrobium vannielii]ADP70250.1 hydrogenase accessory protein HypB [Rhodomicrobium vannielii ATCC 17100]
MCGTCGCGDGETKIEAASVNAAGAHQHGDAHSHDHTHDHDGHHHHDHTHNHAHEHTHEDGVTHSHPHEHHHTHDHEHGEGHEHPHEHGEGDHHDHGHGHAHSHGGDDHHHDHEHSHEHGHTHEHDHKARVVKIEQDVLSKNDAFARENRARFTRDGILALNLVSSPGSGKTTLLVASIERLKADVPVAVIEGDQQTTNDAERIRATGAPAIQINTGKGCHLDAHMTGHAADHLALEKGAVLFIENVGNLVCPAMFDLGEEARVVLCSVTEGEDKPLKYPDMFRTSHLMLITKVDLLPHLDFDADLLAANARAINPRIKILRVSAKTGEGMDAWAAYIKAQRALALTGLEAPGV